MTKEERRRSRMVKSLRRVIEGIWFYSNLLITIGVVLGATVVVYLLFHGMAGADEASNKITLMATGLTLGGASLTAWLKRRWEINLRELLFRR